MSVTRLLRTIWAPRARAPAAIELVALDGSVQPSLGVWNPSFTSLTSSSGCSSTISDGPIRWHSTPTSVSTPWT